MMKYEKNVYEGQNVYLQYYEFRNGLKPLVLLHAQAVDSTSYFGVMPKLAQHFHVYAVNCYGHGGSLHDASKYNITDIGNAVWAAMGRSNKPKNLIQKSQTHRRRALPEGIALRLFFKRSSRGNANETGA